MKLCFIHIPKTAGTSFGGFLRSQFRPSERELRLDLAADVTELAPAIQSKLLLGGHTTRRRMQQVLNGSEHRYLSLLRSPLERLSSSIEFSKTFHVRFGGQPRDIGNIKHSDYKDKDVPWVLAAARDDPAAEAKLRNIQYRFLLEAEGDGGEVSVAATRSIASLSSVGVMDDVAKSILVIAQNEGLVPPRLVPFYNRSREPAEYGPVGKDLVDHFVGLDQLMYEAASVRLNRDYEALIDRFLSARSMKRQAFECLDAADQAESLRSFVADGVLQKRYKVHGLRQFCLGVEGAEWAKCLRDVALRDPAAVSDGERLWLKRGEPARFHIARPSSGLIALRMKAPYAGGPARVSVGVSGRPKEWIQSDGEIVVLDATALGDTVVTLEMHTDQKGLHDHQSSAGRRVPHEMGNVSVSVEFHSITSGSEGVLRRLSRRLQG
jgi:hypothetical protein